ncbi:YdbC family protein [Alkalibacterium psychrotolerans]
MDKLSYEVLEHLAVLSTSPKGWRKELNLVSWNDRPPKFDIREWSPDHSKMSKGITLSNEEMGALKKKLLEVDV